MKPERRRFLGKLLAAGAALGLPWRLRAAPAETQTPFRAGVRRFVGPFFFGKSDAPVDLFGDLCLMRKGPPDMTYRATPASIEAITTRDEWAIKAAALRDILQLTLGRAPELDCPLDMRVEGEIDRGDVIERRITYQLGPDERTASLLLVPKHRPGPRPALLTIHPTTPFGKGQTVGRAEAENGRLTERSANRAYGLHLALRGYVTFSPDLLGAGERIYPGRRHFDNQPLLAAYPQWSGTGKDLWDLRRALDVMESIPEIDPRRIGSIGHSQGGGLTGYLMAVDDRVRLGVSNCGHWPSRIRENPFHIARTDWWTGRPALRAFCWAGKPMPIDLHEILALAAPRPFLNMSALNDCGFGIDDEVFTRGAWENLAGNVARVYQLAGGAGKFSNVLHLDGHDFPEPMRELAYGFIARHL